MSENEPIPTTIPEPSPPGHCRVCREALWSVYDVQVSLCWKHAQEEREHEQKLSSVTRDVDWLLQRAIEQYDKDAVAELGEIKIKLMVAQERRRLAVRLAERAAKT